MEILPNIIKFTQLIGESINQNHFIKLTLSSKRKSDSDLKNVYVKPVMIRNLYKLSFVYRYITKDITLNYEPLQATEEIKKLLSEQFMQANLATTVMDYNLLINKKGNSSLLNRPPASTAASSLQHDKVKQRIIDSGNNYYLYSLGVINQEGKVKPDMQDKYRQINKYIELVDGIIKDVSLPAKIQVADMGSGKGYLTFAIYDYMTGRLKKDVQMTGIELRKELVDSCNKIAQEVGYKGLDFKEGTIEATELPSVDVLIALHACDTATDEAIYRGIKSGAQIILCSPCCHKQVRRDMLTSGILSEITQYGILAERQAEILTDTIRALMLEAYGYRTNVAEFIATEHTPKNLIISAVKKKQTDSTNKLLPDPAIIKKINELKVQFQLRSHYLQELLEK